MWIYMVNLKYLFNITQYFGVLFQAWIKKKTLSSVQIEAFGTYTQPSTKWTIISKWISSKEYSNVRSWEVPSNIWVNVLTKPYRGRTNSMIVGHLSEIIINDIDLIKSAVVYTFPTDKSSNKCSTSPQNLGHIMPSE